MYALLTFNNTHSALYMESCADREGLDLKLIPVPSAISASCGMAARVLAEDLPRALKIMKLEEIEAAGAFSMDSNGKIEEILGQ